MVTMSHTIFLKEIKKYPHIRVKVDGGLYFRVSKKEIMKTIETYHGEVTFSTMNDPKGKSTGVLFIEKIRSRLLVDRTLNSCFIKW